MQYNLKNLIKSGKVTLQNNTFYVLSVWVKYDENNNNRTSQLQIKNTTAAVDKASVHPNVTGGNGLTEWTKLEVPFLYTDANTNLTIQLNMQTPAATGAVYFDLLQITELVEATGDFTVTADKETVYAGDKVTLKPNMNPVNASTTVVWTSSDPTVATVDANGVVTAVANGTATITATAAVKVYDYVNRKYLDDKATYIGTYEVTVACAHNYEVTGEVDATCTVAGSKTYTCTLCGDTYTEEIAALLHDLGNPVVTIIIEPTCTTVGEQKTVVSCIDCGEEWFSKTEELWALGHTWTDATCTAPKTCSVCGETEGEAIGHNYVGGKCDNCDEAEPSKRLDIRGVSRSKNLALEGTILVYANVAFMDSTATTNAEGLTKEYVMANGRLLFWSLKDMPADPEAAVLGTETHAAEFDKTSVYKGIQEYYAYSHGIPAKEYNDTIYYRTYIVVDGEVYYGDIIEYSVVTYCENQLKKTTTTANKMKPLLAAMLNYGAAAQEQFTYKTDAKANACLQTYVDQGLLDAKHLELHWDANYLTALKEPDAAMTVNFPENDAKRTSKNLGLEGAVETKLTFAYKLNGEKGTKLPADGSVAFYYWTEKTYNALKKAGDVLTKENADYVKTGDDITQTYGSKYGYEYYAMSDGIPAKQLGETIYTAAVFTMADGTEYCSGVTVYSAEEYASGQIAKASAAETLKTLVKWMVVYGETAYTYFNS